MCSQLLHFFGQQQFCYKNISSKKSEFCAIPEKEFLSLHRYIIKKQNNNFFFGMKNKIAKTKYSAISHFTICTFFSLSFSSFMLVTAYFFCLLKREYTLPYIHHHTDTSDERWWKCTCNSFIKSHSCDWSVWIYREVYRYHILIRDMRSYT